MQGQSINTASSVNSATKHVYDGVEQEECRGLPEWPVICCTSAILVGWLWVFVFATQSLVKVEGIDHNEINVVWCC